MNRSRWIAVTCLGVVLGAAAWLFGVVASEESPRSVDGDVRVTITVGEIQGDRPVPLRSYSLVAAASKYGTELFSGSRVPIATTTFQATTPPREVVPMTSYAYQNVGFTADVRVVNVSDGKVRVEARIEDSTLASLSAVRPSVTTMHQDFRVTLDDGVPLEVARAGASYMTVEARILD